MIGSRHAGDRKSAAQHVGGKCATLGNGIAQLRLRPSRGKLLRTGATKSYSAKGHLSANVFRRNLRNFADDDVLLKYRSKFPDRAEFRADIYGRGKPVCSAAVGSGEQLGKLLVSGCVGAASGGGGLFQARYVSEELNSHDRTWISQDQASYGTRASSLSALVQVLDGGGGNITARRLSVRN